MSKTTGEESKKSTPDVQIDQKKLEVAWRYNNLLGGEQNAGDIVAKPNKAMGKGYEISYKFDNSKPMGASIHNSAANELKRDFFTSFIGFQNEGDSAL